MSVAIWTDGSDTTYRDQQTAIYCSGFGHCFSLVCFIATDVNRTDDFAYATYFMSFAIWLLAAYTVAFVIYKIHGFIDFHLLTFYLAAACLLQCVLAFWIDSSPAVQSLVDRYVEQGQAFAQEVDRLYGIGASLDNAGFVSLLYSLCCPHCLQRICSKNAMYRLLLFW
ncbi:hypothetical protein KUH03_31520 [Sphingobacterium sp. E70]|uniref:hypothetical protein n=1 Tax=Sphingobacterium sp. E70 TaxID=2853439 RepID=UPI00211C6590|nr:hypothetical protein [Sphingobacterium sp. E70]ULT23654.1 hypothetical protein KUH03_31520 [Sphingobacterium sp. E70]